MSPMNHRKSISIETAIERLETLCSRAEHSTGELRDKMYRWGIAPNESDKIIQSLTQRRFVDDRRYALALVNDKVKFARWGRRKIAQTLYAKRVDKSIADEALDNIDSELYELNLRSVLESKARTMARPLTYEDRVKLYRHALSRGYESDLAARLIRLHYREC